jgi:hypothetical protein
MQKTVSILLLLTITIACNEAKIKSKKNSEQLVATTIDSSKTQPKSKENHLYDFDTILKNGYNLSYRIYADSIENDTLQSLTLVEKGRDIRTLNETSYPMLHKNLGYIGADFEDSFVFVQSFGSGNPQEIQLINKKTGKEIKAGTWVDADEKEEILVYIENIHEHNEQLKMYDVKSKKEVIINDFKNSKCYKEYPEGLRSCVEIETITKNKIVLKIDTDDEKIFKTYNRSAFK